MSFTVANKIPAGVAQSESLSHLKVHCPKAFRFHERRLRHLDSLEKLAKPVSFLPTKVQSPFWLALAKTQN